MKLPPKHKIAIAITGASGSIYAKVLLDKLTTGLRDQVQELSLVMSDNAKTVWEQELGNKSYAGYDLRLFGKHDFSAPFASGSSKYTSLIVCPCSMGTLGRIAAGISNDLTTRGADVMLKERKKLILVTRDTPLNLIQINNMKAVTEAGGIICPATPSFYSRPTGLEDIAATVIDRVIDLVGLEQDSYRWGEK